MRERGRICAVLLPIDAREVIAECVENRLSREVHPFQKTDGFPQKEVWTETFSL
jgi:hypothetical protein